jgi:hypothetical protein
MLRNCLWLTVAATLCQCTPVHAKSVAENFNTTIRFVEGKSRDAVKDYYKPIGFVFTNSEYWLHVYNDPRIP